jgi:hypothetical protein
MRFTRLLGFIALVLVAQSVNAQVVAVTDKKLLLTNDSSSVLSQAQTAQPFVVEYYYKARWGYADEFLRLFKKNHLPVLQKQIEMGRLVSVKIEKPRYHATEDGRWDFRVTLVFKSAAGAFAPFDEAALARQLYPDQETFKREEQRRFEILLSHWDVPVVAVE